MSEELSPQELGRAISRIEESLSKLTEAVATEQQTQRHRINNIDTIIAGQQQRFTNVDERFTYVGERIGGVEKDLAEIQDDIKAKGRAQMAFLMGLIAEGALLIVAMVLAAR